jgi:uncharacterized protein YciI
MLTVLIKNKIKEEEEEEEMMPVHVAWLTRMPVFVENVDYISCN